MTTSFWRMVREVGYDFTGRRTEAVNQLPDVAAAFRRWKKGRSPGCELVAIVPRSALGALWLAPRRPVGGPRPADASSPSAKVLVAGRHLFGHWDWEDGFPERLRSRGSSSSQGLETSRAAALSGVASSASSFRPTGRGAFRTPAWLSTTFYSRRRRTARSGLVSRSTSSLACPDASGPGQRFAVSLCVCGLTPWLGSTHGLCSCSCDHRLGTPRSRGVSEASPATSIVNRLRRSRFPGCRARWREPFGGP